MNAKSAPERISTLVKVLDLTLRGSVDRIRDINENTHVLAINARIEAARAGSAGRGFRVVAESFGHLNSEIQQAGNQLIVDSRATLEELLALSRELAGEVRGQRLAQLALSVMDVVDRNLYERSCDVRWWATEPEVVGLLEGTRTQAATTARLATILES